jgi:hypothetical protein
MSEPLSWAATIRFVHQRANNCCEYCTSCQKYTGQPMHVDHIIPGAGDHHGNLALACASCNLAKQEATEADDPDTGERVPLFNPRTDKWTAHFVWIDAGARMEGLTAVGRATIRRLGLNHERHVIARLFWIQAGVHPPFE